MTARARGWWSHRRLGHLCIWVTVLLTIAWQLAVRWRMSAVSLDGGAVEQALALIGLVATDPVLIISLSAAFLSMVSWLIALRHLEVSFAFPFMAIALAGVSALGVILFGESMSLLKLAGICTVAIGVLVLRRGG